jgi:hypothetical protein
MKLTKYQHNLLTEYGWRPLYYNDNGVIENTAWIQLTEKHKDVLDQLCDQFNLQCKDKKLKLLIIATQEGDDI